MPALPPDHHPQERPRGLSPHTGARGNTTRGFNGRGALQGWPEGLRAGATQGAPRSSRQSEGAAPLPIVTHTPPNPRIAFPRTPPYGHFSVSAYVGGRLGMGSAAIGSSLAVGRLEELGASGSQSRARPSRAALRSSQRRRRPAKRSRASSPRACSSPAQRRNTRSALSR
jgi:hypothetical protein